MKGGTYNRFSNLTFRNGYLDRNNQPAYDNNASFIFNSSSTTLENCNVFNMSAIVSSTDNTAAQACIAMQLTANNCHLSGIFYNGSSVIQYCLFNGCDIHDVSDSVTGITNYTSNNIYSLWLNGNRNYLHDCVIKRGSLMTNGAVIGSIVENVVGENNSILYGYNTITLVNCLIINCSGFQRLGNYSNCLRNNVFVNNQWGNASYGYRVNTTGTSADNLVKLNNFYDVPITACTNMQAAMNNSGVEGKYCYVSGNHFNMKLSSLGFVDPNNHDYRLKPDSPLISAGIVFSDYNYSSTNKTAPKNTLDILGRRFKYPNPSAGPIQYFSNAGDIPNKTHPLGE